MKTGNRKKLWQFAFVLTFAIAFFVQAANAQANEKSCAGCKAVDDVAAKYVATEGKRNSDQTVDLILAAQKAIKAMPTKSGKLSAEQVAQVVLLLKVSTPSDPGHSVIDRNLKLFAKNEAAFFEEFKKHQTEQEMMEDALDAKLGEEGLGNG